MRPLNRPMFKMGGPVKEGIMDGIREPKADGGTIGGGVIQGQPMGSRTGYRNPLPFLKSAFEPAIGADKPPITEKISFVLPKTPSLHGLKVLAA